MTDIPAAFYDLPADAFPFTVEILDAVTRVVVWSVTIDGPGAVWIPGHKETGDKPRAVRVQYANGKEITVMPQFTCPDCGMVSHNPGDVVNSYCGNCHEFKGE